MTYISIEDMERRISGFMKRLPYNCAMAELSPDMRYKIIRQLSHQWPYLNADEFLARCAGASRQEVDASVRKKIL